MLRGSSSCPSCLFVCCKSFVWTADQHIARPGTVGRADNPLLFHGFDQPGGAGVAHTQASLQQAGAGLAASADHSDGVLVHVVVATAVKVHDYAALAVQLHRLSDNFWIVFRRPLGAQMISNLHYLVIAHKCALDTPGLAEF